MRMEATRRALSPRFEELEGRLVPSGTTLLQQSFDSAAVGTRPSGWSQWSSNGVSTFAISPQALTGPNGLASYGASNVSARALASTQEPANVQVSAGVLVNSLIPTQVLARGSNLNTNTPSYYALSVTRGMNVQLLRVVNGVTTSLGHLNTASWFQGVWVVLTLSVNGSTLQAQVYRPDTGQYLDASGKWQWSQTWALS